MLFLGVALLVVRLSLEGQRVKRVLRMLLVEDVALSISPVWETLHIRRLSKDGLAFVIVPFDLFFLGDYLEILVSLAGCRTQVHFVRIYYFGLLFEVE